MVCQYLCLAFWFHCKVATIRASKVDKYNFQITLVSAKLNGIESLFEQSARFRTKTDSVQFVQVAVIISFID